MIPEHALSARELERYSRNILLENVGVEGQAKLSRSRVFVVGTGGLGSPALLYLAAAGVGEVAFVDHDRVDLTNLQRQILFGTADVGHSKAYAAADNLRRLNPEIRLLPYVGALTPDNALDYLEGSDVVIETSDNLATKFLVNDAAVQLGIPAVLAGILRFEGQLISVLPGQSACYRCLFQSPPPPEAVPSCSEAGVLGAIAGVIGSMQAGEALKILLGVGEPLFGRLLRANLLTGEFRTIPIPLRSGCAACARHGSGARDLVGGYGELPVCNLP